LAEQPIHATPLYSILWNALTLLVLTRLWITGVPLHFIAGSYAILNGLGRFAEEAYRGEPQTPVFAGLKLYQWLAAAMVITGALITAFGHSSTPPAIHFGWGVAWLASVAGLAAAFALGVDFPQSNRRFARLA
jgi:prolipoprotein diacylglyceryltransferase